MANRKAKYRLDDLLVRRKLTGSLKEARALIMAGKVIVNGNKVDKSGTPFPHEARIEVLNQDSFVGRGALKLAGALEAFKIKVDGKVCADVGSSTGGFTEVLLSHGACRVYAIDSAYGELDWKLRNDPRVAVMERTNACYLESLPEKVELATVDISLVSLKKILPSVKKWIISGADILALIKPQYELPADKLPEGAVVRDPDLHREVLFDLADWSSAVDLFTYGLVPSSITGSGGNQEFFMWFKNINDSNFKVEEAVNNILI
jgi:23S rRNA (cytidine1920-2'-O)/16S rRNA (cytidine1409-2'-O)-methyltransferase